MDEGNAEMGLPPEMILPQMQAMVEGIVGASSSRRLVLGAALGAMAGAVPLLAAGPAEAAPSDVKGSPNVAVATYTNQNDIFVVWADGSISKAKTGERVANPSSAPYAPAPGFTRTQAVGGRPSGSPNVCIDVVQDKDGTYLLFADGSLKKPNNAGAAAPPYANVKYYSFFYMAIGGSGETNSPGLTRSGKTWTFDKPFSEVPLVFAVRSAGASPLFYVTGHHSLSVTRTSFTANDFTTTENFGGFVVGKI